MQRDLVLIHHPYPYGAPHLKFEKEQGPPGGIKKYIVNKILIRTFTSDYTVNNANWKTRIIFYKNPNVSF
jgi:hypothetical protein